MPADVVAIRKYIKAFNFQKLFREELGWDNFTGRVLIDTGTSSYHLQGVAEKRGVAVFVISSEPSSIPDLAERARIERKLAPLHFQHILIFIDESRTIQLWHWAKREASGPVRIRTHRFHSENSGQALAQKLAHLQIGIEEEEDLSHTDVNERNRRAFDREQKITKRFYDRFKREKDSFARFLSGIPDEPFRQWYVSVIVNRIMFIYFIQKKGFLDGDLNYLANKLIASRLGRRNRYYRDFLCPLFFEGFARQKQNRTPAMHELLGEIPYLNGGLFQKHQIEELHGEKIQIDDEAFEKLFAFFEEYQWELDERPNRPDNEINPDVLGYIFEKYINQKQMGAYYTKEDITEYISKNTIIPFLLDAARKECRIAFDKQTGIWRLLREDPDRYIYEAIRHGAQLELPEEIAAGLNSVPDRGAWNRTAPPEYGLPTEIWREVVERRRRCQEIRNKLANGEVTEVNDLITLNLDIRQFAQDVIQYCEGPELLRALYRAIEKVSVLDPTCGSGAFLFAALNILKPLYEACLQRMQMFVDELDAGGPHHPQKFEDLREILDQSKKHTNQDYFILKSIIVNNLYGVDIMDEAVEICKLRLFLKLAAQLERGGTPEPLPDIDFNVCSGNALVGYATLNHISKGQISLYSQDLIAQIENDAETLASTVRSFRLQQTIYGGEVTLASKLKLRDRLAELSDLLSKLLSSEIDVPVNEEGKWLSSNKPFHWFSRFHETIAQGGFDVIIGNPPWVEYSKVSSYYQVQGFHSISCNNLWAYVFERSLDLLKQGGLLGLIVPMSLVSTERMQPVLSMLTRSGASWLPSFESDSNPGQLFDGVKQNVTIAIHRSGGKRLVYSTRLFRFFATFRPFVFPCVQFALDPEISVGFGIAKLGSLDESGILKKLFSKPPLGLQSASSSGDFILVHRIAHYYIKAFTFMPFFRSDRDGIKKSEDYKKYQFTIDALAVSSIINSSLFYFYWQCFFDGFKAGRHCVYSFPCGSLPPKRIEELRVLGEKLMEDIRSKSKRLVAKYGKSGKVEYDQFFPRLSKDILDRIDYTLCPHYGLNDEEIDLIINCDIKFRTSTESNSESD